MKKVLVLVLTSILLFTGCSPSGNDSTAQENEASIAEGYFTEGSNIEDGLENIEFVEMTDSDKNSFNSAIESYFYIDSTLMDSDVNYLIEKKDNGEHGAIVLFLKPKDSLTEDFKFSMTEAIMGALSVGGLSVEYSTLQVILYDEDGIIYKTETYLNK